MRHWGRIGTMTYLGMISYQEAAGACDGRAQVTLGYISPVVRLTTSGPIVTGNASHSPVM